MIILAQQYPDNIFLAEDQSTDVLCIFDFMALTRPLV